MKILLKKVTVLNSSISYFDESSAMKVYLNDVNFTLTGDMTSSETDMQILFKAGEFTFIMDGMKYLNKAVLDSKIRPAGKSRQNAIYFSSELFFVE